VNFLARSLAEDETGTRTYTDDAKEVNSKCLQIARGELVINRYVATSNLARFVCIDLYALVLLFEMLSGTRNQLSNMLSLRAWWSNKVSESQDKGQEQTTRPLKKKRSLKNLPKIIHKRKASIGSSCVTEQRHTDSSSTSVVEKKHQRQQQQQQREEKQEICTVKQQDAGPAPRVITEIETLESAAELVSKEQDNSTPHTVQSDSKQQDELDCNNSLDIEESISDSTVERVESANNSPPHSARLHGIVFDERSRKILKEAEDILSTLASRNRSSQVTNNMHMCCTML